MWRFSVWPFSALTRIEQRLDRIERKQDRFMSYASQIKQALDSIAAHLSGFQASIDAIRANSRAAVDAEDPTMLQAVLDEANGLASKFTELSEVLSTQHGVTIPSTSNPAPVTDGTSGKPQPEQLPGATVSGQSSAVDDSIKDPGANGGAAADRALADGTAHLEGGAPGPGAATNMDPVVDPSAAPKPEGEDEVK